MRLNVKALAATCGLLWAAAMLLIGTANLIWPAFRGIGYGAQFLRVLEGIYPGYSMGGYPTVIVLVLYGLVDGAVTGALVAWLYNLTASRTEARPAT